MLAAVGLPQYFKFDTSKLANGSRAFYKELLKLTGNHKDCIVLDFRAEISQA